METQKPKKNKKNTVELDEVGVDRTKIPDQMSLSTSEIGKEFHKTTVYYFIKLW